MLVLEKRGRPFVFFFFFFNDTATTEIYTLSLHDALPISSRTRAGAPRHASQPCRARRRRQSSGRDRKSTRLNSSHLVISYAVFCLKKKKNEVSSTSCRTSSRPYAVQVITIQSRRPHPQLA